MKELCLKTGQTVLVDDADFDVVSRWRWRTSTHPRTGKTYVNRAAWVNGRSVKVQLHRVIMDAPPGMDVDHIDGDPLNCQRSNMRLVTRMQNTWNSRRSRTSRSGFKGVEPCGKRWRAVITVNRVRIHLGMFDTPELAAAAYDAAARKNFGDFCRVNFPLDGERAA
jgi:hypothetical protein